MKVEKWLLDSVDKAFDLPKYMTFNDFLQDGFRLNKEDRLSNFRLNLPHG